MKKVLHGTGKRRRSTQGKVIFLLIAAVTIILITCYFVTEGEADTRDEELINGHSIVTVEPGEPQNTNNDEENGETKATYAPDPKEPMTPKPTDALHTQDGNMSGEESHNSPTNDPQKNKDGDKENEPGKPDDSKSNSSTDKQSNDSTSDKITKKPTPTHNIENLDPLRTNINEDIGAINEILSKSAAGKNNLMAQLFGLSDILGSIEDISTQAMGNEEEILSVIKGCNSKTELMTYQSDIHNYRTKFEDNKGLIKEAKKNQDVDRLKDLLNDLYDSIEDYNKYLLEVS